MAEKFESGSEKPKLEEVIEKLRTVESFTTDKGSVYAYDDEGHMHGTQSIRGIFEHRLKAKEAQDITVFADLDPKELEGFKEAFNSKTKKIRIVEKQPDNSGKIVTNISGVTNPDEIYLGILKTDNSWEAVKKATLLPTMGYNHFDWRNFTQGGENLHERSLGGKVTEIVYKK